MLVLGIDPGSSATGYAALSREQGRFVLHETGVVRTRSEDPMAERMAILHRGLAEVFERARPDAVAMESIFHHRSSRSALVLGQARGVALAVAGLRGVPVHEYNPSTVKASVGGHGRAGKPEVGRLVAMLLGPAAPGKPLAQDAADAVAIAMTHLAHAPLLLRRFA